MMVSFNTPINSYCSYVTHASETITQLHKVGWVFLVGFGFNGPLRQCFSLYRAISQREGERGKKG